MKEEARPVIHINIHGGNNQILPNATGAEQHFHFTDGKTVPAGQPFPPHPWTAEDEARLSIYIRDRERLSAYTATLAACTTARQVGEVAVQMCSDEPDITPELIAREKFTRVLLPFLTGVGKGKGIDNLRLNINDAWAACKRNRQKKGL